MVNYFMLKISFYTAKQFKAKKSLEAYNQLQMDEQFTNVPSSACIEMWATSSHDHIGYNVLHVTFSL